MGETKSERDLLDASRKHAKDILADSAREALAMLEHAHHEAVELLLQQQQEAAALLLGERHAAVSARSEAAEAAGQLSSVDGKEFLAGHDRTAADLTFRQAEAAEILIRAQREVAQTLSEAVDRASADILMDGQRRAASVLLQARMEVEDARTAQR